MSFVQDVATTTTTSGNSQPSNVDSHTTEVAPTTGQPPITFNATTIVQPPLISPTSNIMRGQTSTRPPIRGTNLKNPPYRPPGTVPGGLRRMMNTVRPQTVTRSPPLEVAHHNSATPQFQLQPSHETIQAAS
ncbi:forkhead box protein J3-like isoform X1 [Sesbania bispinosa]|nr:forkhead box protein J3-like isoform X1 [Sesbania bispinosa]